MTSKLVSCNPIPAPTAGTLYVCVRACLCVCTCIALWGVGSSGSRQLSGRKLHQVLFSLEGFQGGANERRNAGVKEGGSKTLVSSVSSPSIQRVGGD